MTASHAPMFPLKRAHAFLACCCLLLFPWCAHSAVIVKLNAPNPKTVALTFDACETVTPSYFDEKILSYLIREEIPFTVFMTGRFARRNPERLKKISQLPFVEIENHSFNHPQHMERLSADEVKKEVTDLDNLVAQITGKRTKYFRFPAGSYDAKTLHLVEGMHYKVVHWSFASGDPDKKLTAHKLIEGVTAQTRSNSILIFHINGRGYKTGEALPVIVQNLKKKGYTFVKLEDGGL